MPIVWNVASRSPTKRPTIRRPLGRTGGVECIVAVPFLKARGAYDSLPVSSRSVVSNHSIVDSQSVQQQETETTNKRIHFS